MEKKVDAMIFDKHENIGKRIKLVCEHKEIKHGYLAHKLNTDAGNFSRQINYKGGRHFSLEDIEKISKILDVPLNWLLLGEKYRFQKEEWMIRIDNIIKNEESKKNTGERGARAWMLARQFVPDLNDFFKNNKDLNEFTNDIVWYVECRLEQYSKEHYGCGLNDYMYVHKK